jgi:hypothetical protein
MRPVTCIINFDDNSIQLFNVDALPIDDCLSNELDGDELYFRDDISYAYFEDKDNSDEYDTDDDDYCEWIQIDLPCDMDKHRIQNYTSLDVIDILKPFKFLQLITIKKGRATICE